MLLIGQGSPRFSFAQHLKGHLARGGQKPCQSCISRFFVSGQEDSEVNRGRCGGGAGCEADEISSRRGSKEQGGQGLEPGGVCPSPLLEGWGEVGCWERQESSQNSAGGGRGYLCAARSLRDLLGCVHKHYVILTIFSLVFMVLVLIYTY